MSAGHEEKPSAGASKHAAQETLARVPRPAVDVGFMGLVAALEGSGVSSSTVREA